jgi:hypothetical protein
MSSLTVAEIRATVARRAEAYEGRERVAAIVREEVERFGIEQVDRWVFGWLQSVVADNDPPEVATVRIAAILAAVNVEREKLS